MNLQEATTAYIGTAQATAMYIGTTKVWPMTPTVPIPVDLSYNDGISPNGSFITSLYNGDNGVITGYSWMLCEAYTGENEYYGLHNTTSQYNWVTSGDITYVSANYISGNSYTDVGAYKYYLGGNQASINLYDPVINRSLFAVTFNASQPQPQQVQHIFGSPTDGGNILDGYYPESNGEPGVLIPLDVYSAADNYETNVLDDTNYNDLVTITSDTGGCVWLDTYDDGEGGYIPCIYISEGSGECTLTYDDGVNTCTTTFTYDITNYDSGGGEPEPGNWISVYATDIADQNSLTSGTLLGYEEEWHYTDPDTGTQLTIRNNCTSGNALAFYSTSGVDTMRMYRNNNGYIEFEVDGGNQPITQINLYCISANYIGAADQIVTTSGTITQDSENFMVTWEGNETTVTIGNHGSSTTQVRFTSIDIGYGDIEEPEEPEEHEEE